MISIIVRTSIIERLGREQLQLLRGLSLCDQLPCRHPNKQLGERS
jgi:hypothetical protein